MQHKSRNVLELSFYLAITDFRLRNEGSYLGVLWYLLDPLLMFIIIMAIRQTGGFVDEILNFPIYLLIGIITLNIFRQCTTLGLNAIRGYKSYIKTMKVSYESLFFSKILQAIFAHVFELLLLFVCMLIFGGFLWGLLLYPLFLLLFMGFVIGLALMLSVFGAKIRDVMNVWNSSTRLLLFATPIFYAVGPDTLVYKISQFNPIFHHITILRDVLIHGMFPNFANILILFLFSSAFLLAGLFLFKRCKHKFAEWV